MATTANDSSTDVTITVAVSSEDISITPSVASYSMSAGDKEALPTLTMAATVGNTSYPVTASYAWSVDNPDCVSIDNSDLTAVASGDTSLTTTVLGETVTISVHVHTYDEEPVFTWEEDYSACAATFTCTACSDEDNSRTVDCTVSSRTTDATCTEDGETVYSAVCEFYDEEYTDSQFVTLPATGHTTEVQNAKAATCTE
ncbi:MAG: hypothetical protein LUH00_04930, partial [Lachnospiraceae bacterium]|nr:hypothetical protein [Lachnospiraceae bacterium]